MREDVIGWDLETICPQEDKTGLVWMGKKRNLEMGGIGTGQDKNK